MKLPQFSLQQLLLILGYCGLVFALIAAARDGQRHSDLYHITFSTDGKLLAALYGQELRVWDVSRDSPRLAIRRRLDGDKSRIPMEGRVEFVNNDSIAYLAMAPGGNWDIRVFDPTRNSEIRAMSSSFAMSWSAAKVAPIVAGTNANRCEIRNYTTNELLGTPPDVLSLSPDGRWLLTTTGIYDTRTAKLHVQLPSRFAGVFSDDGNFFAYSGESGVVIYDLDRRVETNTYDRHGIFLLAFSRDTKTLAVGLNDDTIELWGWANSKRTMSIDVSKSRRSPRPVGPPLLYAFDSDGGVAWADNRLAVAHDNGEISLWNTTTGRRERVLSPDYSFWHTWLLIGAFGGWAVLWGRIKRREKLRSLHEPTDQPTVVVPPTRPVPKVVSIRNVYLRILALMVVLALLPTGVVLIDEGVPDGGGILRLVGLYFGSLAAFLVLLTCVSIVILLIRRCFYGPHGVLLYEIRRRTGVYGKEVLAGPLTGWFAGQNEIEAEWEADCHAVLRRAHELLGEPPEFTRPLIVLGFDRRADFHAAFMRRLPVPCVVSNSSWRGRMVAVCQEIADDQLLSARDTLRLGVALYLLQSRRVVSQEPWLLLVLVHALTPGEERELRFRRSCRRFQAHLKTSSASDWCGLFLFSFAEYSSWSFDETRSSYDRQQYFTDFAVTLSEFLLGDDADRDRRATFLHVVRNLSPKSDALAELRRHAGLDHRQLLSEWQAWLRQQDVSQFEPLSPAKWSQLDRVLQTAIGPGNPSADRRLALLSLADAGHVSAIEPLLELLRDPRSDLRPELVYALASITGQSFGTDVERWTAWWDALPAASRTVCQPEIAAAPEGSTDEPSPVPVVELSPPRSVVMGWHLMWVGGFIAVAIAVAGLLATGPWYLPFYYSLFVGTHVLASVAAKRTWQIPRMCAWQMFNLVNCDAINLLLAILIAAQFRRAKERGELGEGQVFR